MWIIVYSVRFFFRWIDCLVYKMSKTGEKSPLQIPQNCLFCVINSPMAQKYSANKDIKQKKEWNLDIWEVTENRCSEFLRS